MIEKGLIQRTGLSNPVPVDQGGFAASVTPPSNPTAVSKWLSSSISKIQAPSSPAERYPFMLNGQEQTVWIYNGNYYDLYTGGGTASLSLISCPITADPTAASIFFATISGSTLTVSEPSGTSSIPSPDAAGPIQVGMMLQSGTGALIQAFGTGGTTGTGGVGTYSLSASPGTVPNPIALCTNYWTRPVPCIGVGFGGVSGTVAHSGVYQEGTTLYCYFVATSTGGGFTNQHTYVATADITAPTVWTAQSTEVLGPQGTGVNGNVNVFKSGSTYYMFQECEFSTVNPVEGTTIAWQVVLATCSTPTGTFTVTISPLQSLRPGPNGSASNATIYQEGNTFVCYYHGTAWGRVGPTDLFRATNTNLATDTWVITNNGAPMMRRKHRYEVDQLADPSLVTTATGTNYLFYEACDNRSGGSGFNLMIAPLMPTIYQYDGAVWKTAESGFDCPEWVNNDRILWNAVINPAIDPPTTYFGAWTPTANTSSVTGGGLVSEGNQNDFITYDIQGLAPGTYTATYLYQSNSSGGVITSFLEDGGDGFPYQLSNTYNLLNNTELLTTGWSALNVTVATTVATTDSNGGLNAFIITATATGADRLTQPYVFATVGLPYTAAVKIKSGTADSYIALVQSGAVTAYATITSGGVVAVSGTNATASATLLNNGWYLLWINQLASSTTVTVAVGPQDNTGLSSGYPACTSGKTHYAYQPQLQQSSAVGQYAPVALATADTYSASPVNNVKFYLTFTILGIETYRRKLKLLMATKNGSSSAYGLNISGISMQRISR